MYRFVIACAALCALAGCSTGEVKLGVDVAPLKQLQAAAGDEVSTGLPAESTLELTRVRLLIGHAKVGYGGGCRGEEGADVGPFVVDLTADEIANGAHREFSLGELATGTYRGAEIEIQPLESEQDASADEFADFKSGASVLVEGINGRTPFSFAGHFLAEQGTDGEVTIDEKVPLSLPLSVDTSTWFRDANDAVLDPTDAAQHDTLAVAICKTLDTQEPPEPSKVMEGHRGGGPGGGGDRPHCVEIVP